jgi:phosphohistidine swiveling domain-containing protein
MSKESSVPLILALDDASATLELVGGKGASLARMAAAGLPVPSGFHISTAAYRCFVEEHGLQEDILAAVSRVSVDQPATLDEASKRISELFTSRMMPDVITMAIRQAYARLGGSDQPVAVRSSATAEDLPEMSFAGQQETYLNMRGDAMVLNAVKRCWASLWTARAIGYRARHHIAPSDVSLAVVVQELVPADAAGILFTANPVSGARDQIMINAAWGLGEAIVGGQVSPDTLLVDKTNGTIIQQEVSEKDVMTVRTPDGTHEEAVPAEKRNQAVLSPEQAAELARIGVQIEKLYDRPMDIEWAIHDGRVFIVQARPITALPDVSTSVSRSQETSAVEWQLPDPKGKYMRASVMELLPDPLSPLFATLGLPIWSRATAKVIKDAGIPYLDDPLTVINGYGYYDVTYTPALMVKTLVALPWVMSVTLPRFLRSAQSRWQKAHSSYEKLVKRWQTMDIAAISATELLNNAREITNEAANYYLTIQSGILPGAYMSEWFFTLAYNKLIKRQDDPPALTFMLGFDSKPILAEKSLYDLAQWVRKQPALASALANMSGNEFNAAYQDIGAQPAVVARFTSLQDNEAWTEFRQRFAVHLASFGNAIYDLDFAKPLPAEDPASQLETLKFFLSGLAPDPYARQKTAETAREQAVQKILSRLHGVRLSLFNRQLNWAQSMAPLREDAIADTGLGWPVLRQILHEIGHRLVGKNALATSDDVFWLTLDELQEAAFALDNNQTPADYHTVVAGRHATWEKERAVTPPTALPLKDGARWMGIDFSNVMPSRSDQPVGDVIKGIAGSPGRITGPARVIHGPQEFDQMRQGDVLVARITTPAWTPLFALASAVVTDVGGPLSHSSIVAREYHIPAVLGTGVATERLHNGQSITVDGDAGAVTLSAQ